MKFTYEQTTDQLIDLSKHSLMQNKWLKITLAILALVIILNLFLAIINNQWESLYSWLLPLAIIGVIWSITYFFIKKRMQNPKGEHLITGQREIEFLEDKIILKTPVSDASFLWKAVSKLETSDKNYFIYLGKRRAIVLPKSAIANEEEKFQFEQLLYRKIGT